MIQNRVGAHFVAAKTFLPELADQKDTSYTFITGVAGEKLVNPDASLVTVCDGALHNLSMVLRDEFKDKAVRVNEVCF